MLNKIGIKIKKLLSSKKYTYTAELARYDYIEDKAIMILSNLRKNGELIANRVAMPADRAFTKLDPMIGDILLFEGELYKHESYNHMFKFFELQKTPFKQVKIIAFNQNFSIDTIPYWFLWGKYKKALDSCKIKKRNEFIREPNIDLLNFKLKDVDNLHKQNIPIFMDKRSFLRLSPNKETDKVIERLYEINNQLIVR